MLSTLRDGYRALVLGANGALGGAFVRAFEADGRCAQVVGIHRNWPVPWDLRRPEAWPDWAAHLETPFHVVVDATGALVIDGKGPEKRLQELDATALEAAFQVNAVGPLLLIQRLSPLLARGERVIWAKLSARVGSIEDNHKGGWYGYRMAKAALNQGLQTAAIELARQRPECVVAALQPGTVRSRLSRPFVGDDALDPDHAARGLLQSLDGLLPHGRAHFVDHKGQPIPW